MKNDNHRSFTVRLNLNKPRHRLAWEKLNNSDGSLSATIVRAITPEMEPSPRSPCSIDAEMLKGILRQVIAETLTTLPVSVQPVSVSEESDGREEISDDDFDAAIDFMGKL